MRNKIKTTIALLIIAAIICCACSAESGGKDALDENDNISISENIISENNLKETSKDNPNTQENVEEVDIGKLEWVDYTFAIPDEGVSGLYKDFLTNNEKAKYISASADEDFDYELGDYFEDERTYDISELIGNVGRMYSKVYEEYRDETVDDVVVSSAEYSFIDCGNDGEYELFIELYINPAIDGEVVNEYTGYLVVLKDFKGELKTCYCGITCDHDHTLINKYGVVYSFGSGGTGGSVDLSFIDRSGNWHYLYGYEYNTLPTIYPFDGFGKYDDIPAVDDWTSLAFWFDCANWRDHEKYYFTYLINNKEEWSDKLIAGESIHYRSEDYEPGNELFDYFENEDLDITPFYEIEKMISKKNKAEGFDTNLFKAEITGTTLFPITNGEPARCIHLSDVYYPYYDKNVDIYLNVFSDYNKMNLLVCDKGKALDTYEISHYSLGLKYDEEEFARNITSINEIQICDYNMDGLSDVIVTYSIDGAIKAVLLEGRYNNLMRPKISECEKESYYLFIDSVLTDRVNEFLNPPTAENIKKYMGFNESGMFDNWRDAFLFCVELEKRKSEDGNVRFNLIFIDDDDIPELVVDNNIYRFCDGGLRHYEFYTGDENYYVPQNNCFITHEIIGERVPTDINDTIYCMNDHSLTVIHEGQISLISGDENDSKEQYFVDGIESSKEKYDKIFDRSKALACEAGKLSYEEIYELLTSAPEKYDPEDVTYISDGYAQIYLEQIEELYRSGMADQFALVEVNSDKVPELVASSSEGSWDKDQCFLYTIYNGKAVKLCSDIGNGLEGHYIAVSEGDNIVQMNGGIYPESRYYRIENGVLVEEMSFQHVGVTFEDGRDIENYVVNGESVSREKYEEEECYILGHTLLIISNGSSMPAEKAVPGEYGVEWKSVGKKPYKSYSECVDFLRSKIHQQDL